MNKAQSIKINAPPLRKGEILQLVAFAIEQLMHDGEDAHVLYDQQVKEIHTDNMRQIDCLISFTSGGRDFMHIVEVQDRSKRMSAEFIDMFVGKAAAIGAHRLTVVAKAGFSKGAMAKMRKSHPFTVDALEIQAGKPDEWSPTHTYKSVGILVDGRSERIPLTYHRCLNVTNGEEWFDLLLGSFTKSKISLVYCVLLPTGANERKAGAAFYWSFGGPMRIEGPMEASFTHTLPDGSVAQAHVEGEFSTF